MGLKKRDKLRAETSALSASISDETYMVSAKTLNISAEGVALKCSTVEREQITPKGDFVCSGRPLEVDVVIDFPEKNNKKYEFKARCRVVYSRRLTQDECQLGMYFIDIDNAGRERLINFVEKQA